MKRLTIMLLLFVCFSLKSYSQSYTLNANNSTYSPPRSSAWKTLSTSYLNDTFTVPLGFDFVFFGTTYNSITVSSNGILYFGGLSGGSIDVIGANLEDIPKYKSEIRYVQDGTSGSRYFTIEWKDAGFAIDKSTNYSNISFFISLSESGAFVIRYGYSSALYTNYFYNSYPRIKIQNALHTQAYYVNSSKALVTSPSTLGSMPKSGDGYSFTYKPGTPSISITAPKALAEFKVNTSHIISWTSNDVKNINVDVSLDSGATYSNIAKDLTSSTSAVSYTTPNLTQDNNNCIMRVSDASDTSLNATVKFSIVIPRPKITLFYPAGGEAFGVGDKAMARWRYEMGSKVKLYYATDKAKTWKYISATTGSDSSYQWTIPDDTSRFCSFRVVSAGDTSLHDESDGFFTIKSAPVPKSLHFRPYEKLGTFMLPRLFLGDTFNINWTSTSIGKIDILLLANSSLDTIVAGIANNNTYNWTVPDYGMDLKNVRIVIRDAENGALSIQTLPFDINRQKPELALTYPVGGEVLKAGNNSQISWTSNHLSAVDIWITYDGWNTSEQLQASYNAIYQNYSFKVPNKSSKFCAVKLIDPENILKVFSASKNYFEITGGSGIDAPSESAAFTLYPNPAQEQFEVSFSTDFTGNINIINSLGQLVWSKENVKALRNENLLLGEDSLLPAGVYFVKFISSDKQFTKQLIVQ